MSDPILISIAAALAGRAATTLYDLVKRKLARDPAATTVLEASAGAAPGSAEIRALADELRKAEQSDPAFAQELRAAWSNTANQQNAEADAVANQITGTVHGNAIQARDIQGGINL